MTHELHLAPVVTGPSDAAGPAFHRDTRRRWGRLARSRRRRGADDHRDSRGPVPGTGLIAAHRTPHVVVEIEPGDMAVIDAVRTRFAAGSTLIGVVSDDASVVHLRRTRPWLTVLQGEATDLHQVLNNAGVARPHLILGTLRAALTAETTQRRVIAGVADVLHPDGSFAIVTPLPAHSQPTERRMRRRLSEVFTVVTRTAALWDHAAPAYLLVARNPTRPPVGVRQGEHIAAAYTDLSAAA